MPVLGLKEGGVDWALDKHNEKLVTPEMKAKVDAAKADIIAGKIKVHDYMSNNACTDEVGIGRDAIRRERPSTAARSRSVDRSASTSRSAPCTPSAACR